jgi:hypothetical protein
LASGVSGTPKPRAADPQHEISFSNPYCPCGRPWEECPNWKIGKR